jgi:hypothetical protein
VIVHDLDIFGIASRPAKADAKLIVYAKAPLTRTIALWRLQPVCRRRPEVVDPSSQIELLQLSQRRTLDVRKARNTPQPEQRFSVGTLERLDRHRGNSNALRYYRQARFLAPSAMRRNDLRDGSFNV